MKFILLYIYIIYYIIYKNYIYIIYYIIYKNYIYIIYILLHIYKSIPPQNLQARGGALFSSGNNVSYRSLG